MPDDADVVGCAADAAVDPAATSPAATTIARSDFRDQDLLASIVRVFFTTNYLPCVFGPLTDDGPSGRFCRSGTPRRHVDDLNPALERISNRRTPPAIGLSN